MSISAFTIFSAFPFAFFVALGSYVMYSYGLYHMADHTGVQPAFLAWIPLLRLYTLGQLADRYGTTKGKNSVYRLLLPVLRLMGIVFSIMLLIGILSIFWTGYRTAGRMAVFFGILCGLFTLVSRILECLCYYRVFCDYEPEYAVPYLILCIINLEWVPLFLCRNNVPVGIAGHCRPRQPRYNVNRS